MIAMKQRAEACNLTGKSSFDGQRVEQSECDVYAALGGARTTHKADCTVWTV